MIRSKGEAGTGNVVQAVRHLRSILGDIAKIGQADGPSCSNGPSSSRLRCRWCRRSPRPALPVPMFCAGGLATPADAALAMQLGASRSSSALASSSPRTPPRGPRPSSRPPPTTRPAILAKVSRGLGAPMTGIGMDEIEIHLEDRGW